MAVPLDASGLGAVPGTAQEGLYYCGHGGETGVVGQACVEAVVDLLDDYGDFEARENEIEGHVGDIAAGRFLVALHEFAASHAAGIVGGPPTKLLKIVGIAGLHPIR